MSLPTRQMSTKAWEAMPTTTKPELAEAGLELTGLIYFWADLDPSLTKGHLYSESPNFFTFSVH